MMDNTSFEGMSEEARKLFEKEFERTTIPAQALEEEIRRQLGVSEEVKIEFFRLRRDKFKKIRK